MYPIAYVRTIEGEEQASTPRGLVFCERRGESVEVATCGHCPRFVKVVADEQGGDTLHCAYGEPLAHLPAESDRSPLQLPRLSVAALMTRNIVCVRPDLSLDALTQLFLETGLKAVPVLDAASKLLGFVSETDVVLAIQTEEPARSRTVSDVMMPYALALPETASVTRAAAVMAFEGQHRVAIVSRDGQIVGVLSASDIMYWLATGDGHVMPRPRAR